MVVDWIFGSKVAFSNYTQDRSAKVVRTTDHHMLLADVLVAPVDPIIPPPSTTPTPTATVPTTGITLSPSPTATSTVSSTP
jgi:hypothetical protein